MPKIIATHLVVSGGGSWRVESLWHVQIANKETITQQKKKEIIRQDGN